MLKKHPAVLIFIVIGIILLLTALLTGCGSKDTAKDGDTVQVNYTLKLADGTVYDTSVGKEPLEFVIGGGTLLPDFESAVIGMKVGESKTITILAADAFGERNEDLVFTVDRSHLASGLDPEVGDHLQSTDQSGQPFMVLVTAVSDTEITVDANSPLAGQDLTFDIELLKRS
jgi:peptidylprolyl isomerase